MSEQETVVELKGSVSIHEGESYLLRFLMESIVYVFLS